MQVRRLLMVSPLLLLAACSKFDRKWEKAPELPQVSSVQGRWEGTWKSDKGHGEGALKAVVTPGETPETFVTVFKATYMKVLNSEYTVNMVGKSQPDGRITFHGTKDLGLMAGGVYTYDGWAKGDTFEATYTSKHDNGTFNLKRVP